MRSPDFIRMIQATFLSLCDWPPSALEALLQVLSVSRDVSGITTQEETAGRSGMFFPSWKKIFPPDFHLEGLESEEEQSTRGHLKLFSHLNAQLCLPG